MVRRIAFIHTVAMLVERFRPRFQSELPETDCFHMLDESVLQDLIRQGPSSGITRRIVTLSQVAADAGAELIVFTCSSTSPAIDTARQTVSVPILKIDDPLYARVASAPGRVGLICTTSSTVAPSRALLTAHAQSAGLDIPAESVLCAAAFDALATNRRDLHDRLVCEAAAEVGATRRSHRPGAGLVGAPGRTARRPTGAAGLREPGTVGAGGGRPVRDSA